MPASRFTLTTVVLVLAFSANAIADDEMPINEHLVALRSAGKLGAGFEQATAAAESLRRLEIGRLPMLLDALVDSNPIAENWIRGVVFDIVRRADQIPVDSLADYAMDQTNNPTGRGLAMELIQASAPERAAKLIAKCLDDPSLPLREMAVDQVIEKAESLAIENEPAAKEAYHAALAAARHPQQLETIVRSLRKLGDNEVSIGSALKMIDQWHCVAPFDNVGGVGFDVEYAPEQEFARAGKVDLDSTYKGKYGSIGWQTVAATGDQGVVDLAAAFDKEKGALGYAYTEFESSRDRQVQVRLSSKNANQIWVNGTHVMANEIYHSGFMLDQYVADVRLQQGTNKILLKICQNEQTESWAQDWQFQFRITDASGKALSSGD